MIMRIGTTTKYGPTRLRLLARISIGGLLRWGYPGVNSGDKLVKNQRFENGHCVGSGGSPRGIKPAGVLAAVKARPLGVRASGMLWVPAGLDGVCARSAAVIRGRGEGRACGAVEQGNETTDRVERGVGPINRSLGRAVRTPGRAQNGRAHG